MTITFRVHALQRMFERRISADDVRRVLSSGAIVENYPADHPYPSPLIFGSTGPRPLHVVAAYNAGDDETIIITAYEPDPARWEADFKTSKTP